MEGNSFKIFKKVFCLKCKKHLFGISKDGKALIVYCKRCKKEHVLLISDIIK